jgi:hypothetical protein
MTILYRTTRMPFTPQSGAGLLEKRLPAHNALSLVGAVTYIGDFNHDVWNALYLDDEGSPHVNHGSDPGDSTINLTDSAAGLWVRSRAISDVLNLGHYAHASLDGYHPPEGGTGDPDLSKHVVTANGNITVGQPVYVLSSNVVKLAEATPAGADYARCQVFGLCLVAGTNNNDVTILTEGHVERNDWTIITGSATLTAGAVYFLSETAGQLTELPPSTDGSMIVRVGRAFTTTKLDIEIGESAIL